MTTLNTLTGSEKQISWATDIRDNAYKMVKLAHETIIARHHIPAEFIAEIAEKYSVRLLNSVCAPEAGKWIDLSKVANIPQYMVDAYGFPYLGTGNNNHTIAWYSLFWTLSKAEQKQFADDLLVEINSKK